MDILELENPHRGNCFYRAVAVPNNLSPVRLDAQKQMQRRKRSLWQQNTTFPPYEYYEGQDISAINQGNRSALADELGMDFKIEDMEFDSIIPAVTSGKASMVMARMVGYTEVV